MEERELSAKERKQRANREKIMDAAAAFIRREGTDKLTMRALCSEAGISAGTLYYYFKDKDEILLSFVMEDSFDGFSLSTPLSDIAGRLVELYMILVRRYLSFGAEFMRGFYTPSNTALRAYLGTDGEFPHGTVMDRAKRELDEAVREGILPSPTDTRQVSADVCTIVKGVMFEWCLSGAAADAGAETVLERTLRRLVGGCVNALS